MTLLGSKKRKRYYLMSMHDRKVIHKESTHKNTESVSINNSFVKLKAIFCRQIEPDTTPLKGGCY